MHIMPSLSFFLYDLFKATCLLLGTNMTTARALALWPRELGNTEAVIRDTQQTKSVIVINNDTTPKDHVACEISDSHGGEN
jgi:hypothetical protein